MSTATSSLVIDAARDRIHDALTAAPQLPEWNPAFLHVDGPARPTVGADYALRAIRGMRGTLTYAHISPHTITMMWTVPLLTEVGTWHLAADSSPTRTHVTHTVERRGPLAALLWHTLDGLPVLRLERLAHRTTTRSSA